MGYARVALSLCLLLGAAWLSNNAIAETLGDPALCAPIAGEPACAGAGNPINVMTGNKYLLETDLPALPGKLGIEIVRHYNSLHMGLGQIGYGWRLSYETDLTVAARSIRITQADGSHTIFNRSVFNPSDCACQDPAQGHVMIYHAAQGDEYTWFKIDGQQLHFNHMGKLERITAPTGESTRLTRGLKGELLKVTDPQGRSLIMHYADKNSLGFKGIVAIDSPVGQFNYQHNDDLKSAGVSNLIQVRYPQDSDSQANTSATTQFSTLTKTYHYGEAAYINARMLAANINRPQIPHAGHLLTGTSITLLDNASDNASRKTNQTQTSQSNTTRQRTWMYDQYGRGILSVHGTPQQLVKNGQALANTGLQQVTISYQIAPPSPEYKKESAHKNKQMNSHLGRKREWVGESAYSAVKMETDATPVYPRVSHNGQIGLTTITNSLGQKTTYHYTLIAGEYRLLKILGAGCAECAEPNIVYGYDKLGRQSDVTKVALLPSTQQDPLSRKRERVGERVVNSPSYTALSTIHTDYDLSGRAIKVSRIVYVNGQAQAPQLQARYAYANTPSFPQLKQAKRAATEPVQIFNQPSLIAKPSVLAGKEHQWHITYNPLGQPTQITETGYRPALPSDKTDQAMFMQRSTHYAYTKINGRSLLTQVDGALPNANQRSKDQHLNNPANSDITQYQYDQLGQYLKTIIAPNNVITQLEYDTIGKAEAGSAVIGGTGKVTHVSNNYGRNVEFTYNTKNLLTSITRYYTHGQKETQSFKYNALGNLIEKGSGNLADANYQARMAQGYDDEGRLIWQADALGILKQATYDSHGRLTSSVVKTSRFNQVEHYQYDQQNRLVQISDHEGAIQTITYPALGEGVTNLTPSKTQNNINLAIVKDDFGREVIVRTGKSTIIKQYNSANQLLTLKDENGNTQTYAYDLTGNRIQQTYAPALGAAQTITWRYQQGRLVEVADNQQTERHSYNPDGQLAKRVVSFKLDHAKNASLITLYQYNPDGSMQSQSMPDGTVLVYQRNGQGQVTALVQQTSPWNLFNVGQQTIVSDLSRDMIGLSQITYANGVKGDWQRSQQGILARVVYTQPSNAMPANARKIANIDDWLTPITNGIINQAHAQETSNKTPPIANASNLPGALGLAKQPNALFDARLIYHTGGDVLLQQQLGQGIQQTQAYAYDKKHQLVAAQSSLSGLTAQSDQAKVWRYHYDERGNRILTQANVPVNEMGRTIKTAYKPANDATLNTANTQNYVWNSLGQLAEVKQDKQTIAKYNYNASGLRFKKQVYSTQNIQATQATKTNLKQSNTKQTNAKRTTYTLYNLQRQRIADLSADGHITRQYIWLGDKLVATLDAKTPKTLQAPADDVLSKLIQTIQTLWQTITGQTDQLAFVHVNHLHAPVAVTNTRGQVIWQADYAPYGEIINTTYASNGSQTQPRNKQPTDKEAAQSQPAHYTIALRNAGQWQDDETGLYYNDQRYYHPQTGRYISVDPLGKLAAILGSPNPYSYVNNNPVSYIDPWGLILFAFDGTGNTFDNKQLGANESVSNVWKFTNLYNNGNFEYISGVGTIDTSDPNRPIDPKDFVPAIVKVLPGATDIEKDMAFNYSGRARITRMQEYFNKEAELLKDDSQAMDVDIIGFSRGAAQARDFANKIMSHATQDIQGNYWYAYKDESGKEQCQKVNFRFMGLWDTVLSTDAPLGTYQLQIPVEFQYVAQAVALNEHRGDTFRTLPGSTGAFPLESIMGGNIPANQTRIEKGFIGVHSDIGGGFAEDQLSQVALVWMIEQAKLAGVQIKSIQSNTIIANPVLHDKSDNQYANDTVAKPSDSNEDRTVTYADGSTVKQKDMSTAGMSWLDTQNYISYNPPGVGKLELQSNGSYKEIYAEKPTDATVGKVDMTAYLTWLNDHGYTLGDLQVQ